MGVMNDQWAWLASPKVTAQPLTSGQPIGQFSQMPTRGYVWVFLFLMAKYVKLGIELHSNRVR